ncbi:MAG TPA: hypothetical protein VHE35_32610, partial [Kofleriaceae bacterium]|nr:hypothetical protein [Kofleriaceae bacterium]
TTIALTARGEAAAELVVQAVQQVDELLYGRLGADGVVRLRRAIAVLVAIARDDRERAAGTADT